MNEQDSLYVMELSLNVLEHLGINLYSNVPSVLSEVVANAWDADAPWVKIDIHEDPYRIVIQDRGKGMTREEVNKRFLTVGYRKRDHEPGLTPKGRTPMGRKGIGKLSLFSIADMITVETVKNAEKSAFQMNLNNIREAIKGEGNEAQKKPYRPEALDSTGIDWKQGTRITLDGIRKRYTIRTPRALRKRLARRFSIIGDEFEVFVNGDKIVPADRGYYHSIQFLWTYGQQSKVIDMCAGITKPEKHIFDRTDSVKNKGLAITGWLGTVKKSEHLKDEDGDNLNRIAIFFRGKLAQEDILADFSERGVYASYLIGEIHAEQLDQDDQPDAATSSRQKIVEDDERYETLKKIIHDELKFIQNRWTELRSEEGAKKALEIPAVNQWMNDLPKDLQPKAKGWLGKLNRMKTDDPHDQKKMIKHAVLAFEFYRANQTLDRIDRITDESLDEVLKLFADLDSLEYNLYGQIVHHRIAVIRTLQEKVDQNTLEKVIQQYIFDHLWLIDPAWERADASEHMETRVEKLFDKIDANLSKDERNARIDIQYRKTAGAHVIIELKRPDRKVGLYELAEQVEKYRSGMQKILEKMDLANEPIQIICLLGNQPREYDNPGGPARVANILSESSARVVLYDMLLTDAYKAYNDYLKERKSIDRLDGIIQAIEDYAP
ncbi:MAG: ATP-binding protein [Bacteroidota bacterium]